MTIGFSAALLVQGATLFPQLNSPILEFLVDASFSIYFVRVNSNPVVLTLLSHLVSVAAGDATIVALSSATIALRAADWLLFERPTMAPLRRKTL